MQTAATFTSPAADRRQAVISLASIVRIGAVVVSSLALLVATANPIVATVPLLIFLVAYGIWILPLRYTLYPLAACVIIADIAPRDLTNTFDQWKPPTYVLQQVLVDNLNKLVGIDALRFSGTEVVVLMLLALCALRLAAGTRRDSVPDAPFIAPLAAVLALSFVGVAALELWGLARGGDFRQSLWQLRWLLWLPLLAAMVTFALRRTRDYEIMLRVITWTAAVKIAIGFYYFRLIAQAGTERPQTVTSHNDTVLFVVVMAVWIASYVHRRTRRQLLATTAVTALMLFGMIINNRRTAYVSLAAVLITLFAVQHVQIRRSWYRWVIRLAPIAALYLFIGQYQTKGIFAPAASLLSVFSQKDASSATRDIENYNLIATLKNHLIVGSGWGHQYAENSVAFDISTVFEQYRYVPHNSVLWLLSVGGIVGFTAMWLALVVGIFFATRAYLRATTPAYRTAAYSAIAIFTAFIVQAWADMGTQSWTNAFLAAYAFAVSGRLAAATGAWPSSGVPHAEPTPAAAGPWR